MATSGRLPLSSLEGPSGPAPPPDWGSLEQNRAGRDSPKTKVCAKHLLRLSHLTDTHPVESTLLGSLLPGRGV